MLGCGSAGEPDEVVDVDEDKVGKVSWGDVGDKLEMVFKEDEEVEIVVKGEGDKFAKNNDEDEVRLLISVTCVVS